MLRIDFNRWLLFCALLAPQLTFAGVIPPLHGDSTMDLKGRENLLTHDAAVLESLNLPPELIAQKHLADGLPPSEQSRFASNLYNYAFEPDPAFPTRPLKIFAFANEYARRAAQSGDPISQTLYAELQESEDSAESIFYYKKATAQNYPRANLLYSRFIYSLVSRKKLPFPQLQLNLAYDLALRAKNQEYPGAFSWADQLARQLQHVNFTILSREVKELTKLGPDIAHEYGLNRSHSHPTPTSPFLYEIEL